MGSNPPMAGLITLPLRLSIRVTGTVLRAAERVAVGAMSVAGEAVKRATGGAEGDMPSARDSSSYEGNGAGPQEEATVAPVKPTEMPTPEALPPAPTADETETPTPTPAPTLEAMETPAPAHVSEEPELVEERADPGAEEGAGPEVRIDAPWAGYDDLRAGDVIARVERLSAEELAAIELYERVNRARQTVLSAVERQLALLQHGGSTD